MSTFLISFIPNLFYLLFFFVPLVLWPYTSELFEFNKMLLVYILTVLIAASWTIRMTLEKKIIFRRTILDIPLLIFLASQILSTLISIDPRTSFLGYYSRFHGGLLSSFSYALLYWAYVSNINKKQALSTVYCLLSTAVIVSIYGILQHFGIDKDLWVQDVQNRVFSTLGQPNWLAAYLVALIPISWAFTLEYKSERAGVFKLILLYSYTLLLFITLLFTKSRSGILGFAVADLIFWGFILIKYKKEFIKQFIICHSSFIIISLAIGFPFPLFTTNRQPPVIPNIPALESGGTESGTIRKIVWRGALDIWKHNLILGTGPETFAYSYYRFRPTEHNLVSEWDFIYNKAHNEYLNYLATTGTLGAFSYLLVILFSLIQISNFKFLISKQIPISKNQNSKNYLGQLGQLEIRSINIALLAGYVSILVTNFFGFSVVPVALEFFLFPAMAIAASRQEAVDRKKQEIKTIQKMALMFVLLATNYLLLATVRYWYSDIFYNKAKQYNLAGKYPEALSFLQKAVRLSPKEALYRNELSQTLASLADEAQDFTDFAIAQSNEAVSLSPANINILRNRASLFYKLSKVNPEYLKRAIETLLLASVKAPTDAKIFYNLGLMYLRTGQVNNALDAFEKTISLKPNYKEARLAYALTLIDVSKLKEAKEQFLFILEKIDPNDKIVIEELNKLK